MINLKWNKSSQLKCLATLPCDLSLITIHISDCCQFSDIHILQGSVTTKLQCGWIFQYEFFCKFTTESVSERLLNIGSHLAKFGQEFIVLFFLLTCGYNVCDFHYFSLLLQTVASHSCQRLCHCYWTSNCSIICTLIDLENCSETFPFSVFLCTWLL